MSLRPRSDMAETHAPNGGRACPSCGQAQVVNLGPLPDLPGTFGGQAVRLSLTAGSLFHCRDCDLRYRHPYQSQDVLTGLYETLPPTVWRTDKAKPHWRVACQVMTARSPNQSVLDVGCFTGDFLAWLPSSWDKLGIEPNTAARTIAASRGIQMIGSTIDNIASDFTPPGTIVLFDVLEHMTEPLDFLGRLKALLAPGGLLVIVTGNTNSLAWRMFGRHYWYSSLPEHVSFFSPRWFRVAGARLGLSVVTCERISSGDRTGPPWLKQAGQLSLYTLVQKLRESGLSDRHLRRLPLIRKAYTWRSVPWWTRAKDHVLVGLLAA